MQMSTKTKQNKKVKVSLDSKNLTKAAKDAAKGRATKYSYPSDVASKEDRKKYRRMMRAKKAELEGAVNQAKSGKDKKELEKAQSALSKFQKDTYTPVQ